MNILVIGDNIAILEVLTEIMDAVGHKVRVSESENDAIIAISEFSPNIILLDTDMNNGNGLKITDRIQEVSQEANVVVLRSWNEQIPRDNTVIKGFIQKPFTSSDVLERIEGLMSEDEGDRKKAPTPQIEEAPEEVVALGDRGISFGESYVMFRNDAGVVSGLVSSFGSEGYNILLITTGKKKAIEERFGHNRLDVHFMSIKLLGGYFNIYRLGSMIDIVRQFVTMKEMPVVVFDNINPLISRNGMNSTLTAIHQTVTSEYEKKVSFVVCVDTKNFTDKDKEILLSHMRNYNPTEE